MTDTTEGYAMVESGNDRSDWEKESLVAHIWWCGDLECDCIQPVVERVAPNLEAGYPWVRRETLWSGTFVSRGYGEVPEGVTDDSLVEELREACKAYEGVVWKVDE